MRLVLFETGAGPEDLRLGALVSGGVADLSSALGTDRSLLPQARIQAVIDDFDQLKTSLEDIIANGATHSDGSFRLRAPLPRPGKILCCIGNYWEHAQREPRQLNMFLKSPDAVIGPGDTVVLPETTDPWVFQHEAELAIVIRGPAKNITRENYRDAIFGYTCLIDVSARGQGRSTWRSGSWMGKSFDTFAPLGPCILTADEVPDPNKLHVRFWNNEQLRHDYSTDDMEHTVPELIEFATSIMTMNSGDVLSCGTNHEGLGPLQDGEIGQIEIDGIGRMEISVSDPLKRSWERGIYMGPDSTAKPAQT
jgi:2-keto-4-pentenoate hydratase/2-oxohepta-3-ene-1,7-dioic acid hydratase in catechol pathway